MKGLIELGWFGEMPDRDEERGYEAYRCPQCRQRFHEDSPPRVCPSCGYDAEDKPDGEDEE